MSKALTIQGNNPVCIERDPVNYLMSSLISLQGQAQGYSSCDERFRILTLIVIKISDILTASFSFGSILKVKPKLYFFFNTNKELILQIVIILILYLIMTKKSMNFLIRNLKCWFVSYIFIIVFFNHLAISFPKYMYTLNYS